MRSPLPRIHDPAHRKAFLKSQVAANPTLREVHDGLLLDSHEAIGGHSLQFAVAEVGRESKSEVRRFFPFDKLRVRMTAEIRQPGLICVVSAELSFGSKGNGPDSRMRIEQPFAYPIEDE